MGSSALSDVASFNSLQEAWTHISRGRRGKPSFVRPDRNSESFSSFEARLTANLAEIGRELKIGEYRFSLLEPVFVPKAIGNGKERLICIPTIRDRLVQRAILNCLRPTNGWMANGVSYGFVPDLDVSQAVQQAVTFRSAKPWVFKTDITAFFDHIDRCLLEQRLIRRVRRQSLLPLLTDAMKCEVLALRPSDTKKLKKSNIRQGRGVRQGMPLSPYFANVMLESFDRACVAQNLAVVRYADDLIFFAASEGEARTIQEFCLRELRALKLDIPELGDGSKSCIYSPVEPAEFLGVELALVGSSYQIRVSSAQMAKIKERVYSLGNLKELRLRNLDITKFGNVLEATCRSYVAAYEFCSNVGDLTNHIATWRRNTIQAAMSQLGIEVSKLNHDGRWFLGFDRP